MGNQDPCFNFIGIEKTANESQGGTVEAKDHFGSDDILGHPIWRSETPDTHLDLSNTSKSYGYTTTDTKLNLKKSDKHSSLFRNYQMASYNVDIGNTSEDGSVAIPDSNKLHESN